MNVFLACNTFTGNKTAFMGIPHDIHEVYYFLPTNMPQFPNCLLYFFTFLLHTVLCLQISLCPRSFTAPSDAPALQRCLSTRFYVHFFSNQASLSVFILIFQNFPFFLGLKTTATKKETLYHQRESRPCS